MGCAPSAPSSPIDDKSSALPEVEKPPPPGEGARDKPTRTQNEVPAVPPHMDAVPTGTASDASLRAADSPMQVEPPIAMMADVSSDLASDAAAPGGSRPSSTAQPSVEALKEEPPPSTHAVEHGEERVVAEGELVRGDSDNLFEILGIPPPGSEEVGPPELKGEGWVRCSPPPAHDKPPPGGGRRREPRALALEDDDLSLEEPTPRQKPELSPSTRSGMGRCNGFMEPSSGAARHASDECTMVDAFIAELDEAEESAAQTREEARPPDRPVELARAGWTSSRDVPACRGHADGAAAPARVSDEHIELVDAFMAEELGEDDDLLLGMNDAAIFSQAPRPRVISATKGGGQVDAAHAQVFTAAGDEVARFEMEEGD
ncbi:hypothetical protein AB1Y20_000094 [Prymnesium parvum]|uniref:Uncharacterized protein n=1 Tax=Prymnesium parvum TaxID=97485 RepID=A0AB34K9H4_PRYPA